MFLRHCTRRYAAQWQVVLRRTYPWFQPGYQLFEKELGEESTITDFRKKFLSITLPRDLAYGGGKPPNYHFGFDAWWKARFQGLPASSTALKVLFDGWDSWVVHVGEETHKFVVQTIKDITAQVIEHPSLTRNIGGQSVQDGEVIVTFVITAGDLELPSGDEEHETQAEQSAVEVTPSARRKKRKEIALVQESSAQPKVSAESRPPPPTKAKRLRKRAEVEYVATEETAAAPTTTSGTDEELREAFDAVEQEKEQEEEEDDVDLKEKNKELEEEYHLGAEATENAMGRGRALYCCSASEPVEQAELPLAAPESEVEVAAAFPGLVVEVPRTTGVLAVMTSPFKPPIVAMPIHFFLGSSATASFVDWELAEFEAQDLDA
ncbi:unnamed protein product [Prunus brigantina]